MSLNLSEDILDPELNFHEQSVDFNSDYYSLTDFQNNLKSSENLLTIVNYNITGFRSNFDYFSNIFDGMLPGILVLTETWFDESYVGEVSNYNSHHTIRPNQRSGGVSVYVSDEFNSTLIEKFSYANLNIEICTVRVSVSNESFFLLCIYRPHHGTVEGFLSELEVILTDPIFRNKKCYMMGDINIDLGNDNSRVVSYVDLMQSFHFFPVINKPTRFPVCDIGQPSLLDHIWCNSIDMYHSGIILSHDQSDHRPTFVQVPFVNFSCSNKNQFIKISFRVRNIDSQTSFSNLLNGFDWNSLYSSDLNQYTIDVLSTIDNIYCKVAPIKTKIVSLKKAYNPWFTADLNSLVQQKSTFFDLHKLGIISRSENNTFKNQLKNVIKKAKDDYYLSLFAKNMNNIKETWRILNSISNRTSNRKLINCILYNGVEIEDSSIICEKFSEYFYNIPQQLSQNIPSSSFNPLSVVPTCNHAPLVFDACTPNECVLIIRNLKNTKQGLNSVPIKYLKDNSDILSVVFSNCINSCISEGYFPDTLKVAKIIPILKKGDPRIMSNYRPISILNFFSKIFEKVIHSRLSNYLAHHNILSCEQFGFRKNLSTLDAIINFTETIYEALNDRKSVINIMIDYSKAFDTVNIPILLTKLYQYGIRGSSHRLLSSYLSDRKQFVSIGDSSSSLIDVNIGVPQGSVLGPLLFLIYVNEIPFLSRNFRPTLFADDCTLSFIGSNINELIEMCNLELQTFKLWSDSNRLTLNLSKTKCLFVSNIDDLPENSILLSNDFIEQIDNGKFLGVIIDDKMKFDCHIKYISSKISKSIGIMYSIRDMVPSKCLRIIYFSLLQSYFQYCLPIFGACYATHLDSLKILQKRAIRIVNNASYYAHTEPLFSKSKILKIDDLYLHSVACFAYKNQHILENYRRSHSHNTRSRHLLLPPLQRLRSTSQSVYFNMIDLWDKIPLNIRQCNTYQSFKHTYKNHLLSLYNDSE